jgi:predicted membrane chloride channel (bestrophin family)
MPRPLVHFVGFRLTRGWDRYWNAVRIWGEPDMIHEAWDCYGENDTAPGDVVIFADGEWDQLPRSFTVEAAEAKAAKQQTA